MRGKEGREGKEGVEGEKEGKRVWKVEGRMAEGMEMNETKQKRKRRSIDE